MEAAQDRDYNQMRNVDVRTVEREASRISPKYILTPKCPVNRGWRILSARLGTHIATNVGKLWSK